MRRQALLDELWRVTAREVALREPEPPEPAARREPVPPGLELEGTWRSVIRRGLVACGVACVLGVAVGVVGTLAGFGPAARAVRPRPEPARVAHIEPLAGARAAPLTGTDLPFATVQRDALVPGLARRARAVQVADTIWEVDRAALAPAFESSHVRLVPQEGGGVRLYGVARASVLSELGLRTGDTLIGVNGHPIDDDPVAVALALSGARVVVLDLVRDGAPRSHTYLIAG